MAKKSRRPKVYPRIEDTSKTYPKIDYDLVAKGLGADYRFSQVLIDEKGGEYFERWRSSDGDARKIYRLSDNEKKL